MRNDRDHGYLDVTVEEGTLTAQALTPSGQVIDSFTLTKDLPPAPDAPVTADPSSPPATSQPAPTQPGTPTPAPVTGSPGLPGGPDDLDEDLDPNAPGCSAVPAMALLPAGVLVLAGALRRRRRR